MRALALVINGVLGITASLVSSHICNHNREWRYVVKHFMQLFLLLFEVDLQSLIASFPLLLICDLQISSKLDGSMTTTISKPVIRQLSWLN